MGGGGANGPETSLNAERYFPSYLYNANNTLAARPKIKSAPTRLTVDKGTRLVFRWEASNFNLHDVVLDDGPDGVEIPPSRQRTTDYTVRRTLRRSGTYKFICTLHATQMRLTVRVRRG